MKKTLPIAAAIALLLSGCEMIDDPIYRTMHPDQGKIVVSVDWSGRGTGVSIPSSHTVRVGTFPAVQMRGDIDTLDRLFDPGDYSVYVYNTADRITVNSTGTSATASYSGGTLGWFFSRAFGVKIEKDQVHTLEVAMTQQVRQLTLLIEPTGGSAGRVASITASLSGVAGTFGISDGSHDAPVSVPLTFTRITSGTNAGKWTATTRLLGVAGASQRLTGTIAFTDGIPANVTFDSNLTSSLADFNTDKKTPLTLSGTVVPTPSGSSFTATIAAWIPITGPSVVAE